MKSVDRKIYQPLIAKLFKEVKAFYGERLVTFSIFGSYARNQMKLDSDLDILMIVEGLPKGRMRRVTEFLKIEKEMQSDLASLHPQNIHPYLSPIFKTPEEAKRGSPLFLDMTEEVEIFFDRGDFFKNCLDRFRKRLRELGSKRVWKGNMWYWILKPDLKPGEVIEL